jgi:hypothetical protein
MRRLELPQQGLSLLARQYLAAVEDDIAQQAQHHRNGAEEEERHRLENITAVRQQDAKQTDQAVRPYRRNGQPCRGSSDRLGHQAQ